VPGLVLGFIDGVGETGLLMEFSGNPNVKPNPAIPTAVIAKAINRTLELKAFPVPTFFVTATTPIERTILKIEIKTMCNGSE
jgi:hypothetical protein